MAPKESSGCPTPSKKSSRSSPMRTGRAIIPHLIIRGTFCRWWPSIISCRLHPLYSSRSRNWSRWKAVSSPTRGRWLEELLKRRSQPGQWFQLLQIKTPGELAPEFLQSTVSRSCKGWILLTLPEAREKILPLLDQACCRLEVRDFDPLRENLSSVMLELREKIPEAPSSPLHLSLVAPFYLLKRDGISSDAFPRGSAFAGLTLFANNYSLIKRHDDPVLS